LQIGKRHSVHMFGQKALSVDAIKIKRPCCISYHLYVEAEISGHPSRSFNAVICGCADDYDMFDVPFPQPRF
jgi:hypothetical protein